MILPGTGRGTMRSMVEGRAALLRKVTFRIAVARPSTTCGGPPPLKGRIILKYRASRPS